MGCCGKKHRGVTAEPIPRGSAVRELVFRRPTNPAPPTPPPIPAPPIEKSGGAYTTEGSKVCKACGARLQVKRIWSERLMRYYPVSWCSNCSKEV